MVNRLKSDDEFATAVRGCLNHEIVPDAVLSGGLYGKETLFHYRKNADGLVTTG